MPEFDTWDSLELPWRRCLELAWQSFQEGSVPVGAVITDAPGGIVAEGRNRSFEQGSGDELAGSLVAHAELSALNRLEPGEYGDHVLWSSLEPCFLCAPAVAHSHVGTVRYAAADPLVAGVQRMPEINRWLGRRWPTVRGPESGPVAWFAGVLHAAWSLDAVPDGVVVKAYLGSDPWLLEFARRAGEALRAMRDAEASHVWSAVMALAG